MMSFMTSRSGGLFFKMVPSKQTAAEIVKLYFETKFPIPAILIMKKKYPGDATLTKF